MAKYFMELSLVDYGCMKFLPSEIAAAALYIAMKADDGSEWTPTCEYYSMYSESKLLPCARRLASLITKTLDGSARLKVRHGCMNGKVPQEKLSFFVFLFFFFVIRVSVPQQPIFYTGFIFTKTPTFSIRIKIAIYQCYFDLNFACFWLLLTLSWYLKSIWRTLMDGKGQRGTIFDLVITCNCSIHFLFEKVNSKICLPPKLT